MSYLGNEPPQLAGYSTQTKAAPVGSSITLNQEGTVNSTLLFLDGVRQTPTTDYTISGTTLTLTSTAPTSAVATILFLGDVTDIGQPSNDTVDVDQLNTTSTGSTGQFLKKTGASTVDWGTVTTDTSGIEEDIALLGFKVATNGSWSKYNLVDQTEDAFVDATGIDAALSTNEVRNSANYYTGGSGDVTVVKSYTGVDQSFSVPSSVTSLTFIAWGAAGGGGGTGSSIGGGGGFIEGDITVTPSETLTVKVGGGGAINHVSASQPGGGGGGTGIYRSSTVLAIAGAGGAGENSINGGAGGGTTGGSGANGAGSTTANGGTQSAGGAAVTGGGAGSLNQGGNAPSSVSTAAGGYNGGGSGNGDNVTHTSGGGGGGYYGGSSGGATSTNHGSGAGGSSLTAGTNTQASGGTVANAGHANYAAGTGNGVTNSAGQNGNAVIKYSEVTDLTLVSNATTAETTATKGDIVMTYTNGAGTTTINTDLTAEFSADNGSNWTSMTLEAQGTTGTSSPYFIVSAHDVTAGTSGTEMRYRIKTFNQGGAKITRIQAVSLGWS